MPRLFVGLPIPPVAYDFCSRAVANCPAVRATAVTKLHLTLHFLGDISHTQQQEVCEQLREIQTNAFDVTLSGRGVFHPSAGHGVLWTGITDSMELRTLQRLTGWALTRSGLQPENRPWRPHVTIARFRSTRFPPQQQQQFLEEDGGEKLVFRTTEFLLYESRADPPDYYPVVQQFPLL
jgi:2'-5' RNA ligase